MFSTPKTSGWNENGDEKGSKEPGEDAERGEHEERGENEESSRNHDDRGKEEAGRECRSGEETKEEGGREEHHGLEGAEQNDERGKEGSSQGKEGSSHGGNSSDPGEVAVQAPRALPGQTGGRTYHVVIPIRPLSGHVQEEHLDSLALYFFIYGVIFAVAGAVSVATPLLVTVKVALLVEWTLVVAGVVSLLQVLLIYRAPGTFATLLLGALHLGTGLWLILEPISGSTALTFVISLWFLAHGFVKILMTCCVGKVTTWPVLLLSGLLSLALAFVVLALTPTRGEILIAISFGVDILITGFAFVLLSLMAYLGKGHRSVTDADAIREPLLSRRRHGS